MPHILSQTEISNLVSGGIGTLAGYITRSQHNRHEVSKLQLNLMSQRRESNLEDQKDARSKGGVPLSGMRFLMIGALAIGILILFVLPGFFHWKVNMETIHSTGILARLFKGPEQNIWHTFTGLVIPDQFWQLCFYICGFLFGGRG